MDHLLALRAFVRIAESGSFAKAADYLNMPRSSVSKLLQDLESHLGAKLIERNTRSVTITEVGAAYSERATRLLAEIEEMDGAVAEGRAAPKGRLRVDVGSSVANIILLPALPDFQARYPDIDLQLGISDRYVDLVGEGVDCVIRTGVHADSTLVARKLCELDWVTCASRSYFEGRPLPDVPEDLGKDHRIVGYFSAASGRAMPLRFSSDGQQIELNLRTAVAVNESTAHLGSLILGLGIGQTYRFMAKDGLDSGDLIEVLKPWQPGNQTLHLVYPKSRFPSPKLQAFSDWVAELCRAHDARRSRHHP